MSPFAVKLRDVVTPSDLYQYGTLACYRYDIIYVLCGLHQAYTRSILYFRGDSREDEMATSVVETLPSSAVRISCLYYLMPWLFTVVLTNTSKTIFGSTSRTHLFLSAFSVPSSSRIIVAGRPRSLLLLGRKFSTKPKLGAAETGEGEKQEQPRTGWLHRTVPRVTEQRKEKESTTVFRLRQEMVRDQRNHRIISPPTFYPSGEENRSIMITEHKISAPLERDQKITTTTTTTTDSENDTPMIDIFFTVTETLDNTDSEEECFRNKLGNARMTSQERASEYVQHIRLTNMEKGILYLQGGPGFGAPAPISGITFASKSSWAGAALSNGFKRIVLMDPRGTGRSSPITKQTLEMKFPGLFAYDNTSSTADTDTFHRIQPLSDLLNKLRESHPDNNTTNSNMVDCISSNLSLAINYMSNFRADNIVHDAESIKDALLQPPTKADEVRPWGAVLGQSFGGFCIMTYLSIVANPPKICLLTGGIAPMLTSTEDVYTSLWERVKQRNLMYYDRYPADIATVKKIVRTLLDHPAKLPSGGNLTARRFLQLGFSFLGGSPSSFASLHNLLAIAFVGDDDEISNNQSIIFSKMFLKQIDSIQPFDNHPIYFLLHESIYANGKGCSPTHWAAHAVYERLTKTPSEYRYDLTSKMNSIDRPTLFFGEMVFPWMADGDYAELSGLGMKLLAHGLAQKSDWSEIYNAEQMRKALGEGKSKATAAVYFDDMYVDFDASIKVTRRGAPLEKCKLWITNEYQHSGLRDNGAEIFSKLLHMTKGSLGVPS